MLVGGEVGSAGQSVEGEQKAERGQDEADVDVGFSEGEAAEAAEEEEDEFY